ncbi:MAG: NAD-dependent epimerase/dehydratase family protein, partial [Candidatus Hydrogenedentes bacterium]|nr:NAD-dependent epimerase/dehydratase family protein [Candidatus Hydrogenedentota bacterium]
MAADPKTVLVTGGAGFIGTRLALGIKEAQPAARVIALDNLKRRGSELNLDRLQQGGVEYVHGDVRIPEDLSHFEGLDLILECSAEPSVMAGYNASPRYVIDSNLFGAVHCLELARRTGAAMIFMSTSRVYPLDKLRALTLDENEKRFDIAEEQALPGVSAAGIDTDFPIDGARSLYGATKYAAETLIAEYVAMYGLNIVVNRCGVIAGPWQMGRVDQGVAA